MNLLGLLKKSKEAVNLPLVAFGGKQAIHSNFFGAHYQNEVKEGYLTNPIVYRCVNLIARGGASVPWCLYRGEVEVESHEITDIWENPAPRISGEYFRESVLSSLLISGNAFVLKKKDDDGKLCLSWVSPADIAFEYDKRGELSTYVLKKNKIRKRYPIHIGTGECDILHLKLFNPLNENFGVSPLTAAALSIDQHNSVAKHNLALLENGARPSGAFVVKPPQYGAPLTDKQRESLKDDLKSAYEGASQAGKVIFLEGDFEWREMGQSLKDLDFIAGKNLSAREIAQCYGVPPMLVGVPGDATFSNYKEARYHLWEDTILPLLDYISAEINNWFVADYGDDWRLKYDADQVPALTLRREASWSKIATVDFLTVNEKRAAVGYGPLNQEELNILQKERGVDCNI